MEFAEFNTCVMLVLLMEPCSFISVGAGMVQVQTIETVWEGWGVKGIKVFHIHITRASIVIWELDCRLNDWKFKAEKCLI